ncbi:MAG: DNA ligase [Deltaproteobacteria bacterium]|nr:DNA ligase [Deltaproteobacteria bacterium]
MSDSKSLDIYREKRNFQKTCEPCGKIRSPGQDPLFVVQKHQASTLHYDFRIEVDGVLKSWAVPKGPSLDPREKRLAVATEDHPLEYADFEGTIPAGEYGGGTVLIWDEGTYRLLPDKKGEFTPVLEGIAKGQVRIFLHGRKLRGGFALQRFKTGRDEAWLLIKMADEEAAPERNPLRDQPCSARSGKSLEEVTGDAAKG